MTWTVRAAGTLTLDFLKSESFTGYTVERRHSATVSINASYTDSVSLAADTCNPSGSIDNSPTIVVPFDQVFSATVVGDRPANFIPDCNYTQPREFAFELGAPGVALTTNPQDGPVGTLGSDQDRNLGPECDSIVNCCCPRSTAQANTCWDPDVLYPTLRLSEAARNTGQISGAPPRSTSTRTYEPINSGWSGQVVVTTEFQASGVFLCPN